MNKVFLAGRIVADPEAIIVKNGATLCRISIACNDAGGRNDEVYFFPCVAWEAKAKFISTYFKKGTPVIVDGRLQRKSYVNSAGVKTYNTEVIIDNIKSFGQSNKTNYNNDSMNTLEYESQNLELNNISTKMEDSNTKKESPIFQDDKLDNNTIEDFDLDWLDEIDDK